MGLNELLAEAKRDPAVAAVLLFGSAARGEPARDTDVAIVLRREAASSASDLHLHYAIHSSGKRHEGLDVSVFQALPVYVRHRVLEDARPLLVNDEDALYEAAWDAVREWEDYRGYYHGYLEAVANG